MSSQSNTGFADYTIAMMDHYINTPSFTVYEVTEYGACFTSVFTSFKQAKAFSKKYTKLSSKIYIFKSSCVKCYEPETESEPEPELGTNTLKSDSPAQVIVNPLFDLSSMVVKSYGRGYLLVPPKTSQYFGDKYFHNGWWIDKQVGWFFKTEHREMLQEYGANFIDESCENLNTLADAAALVSQTHQPNDEDEDEDKVEDEDEDEDEDMDYTPCENENEFVHDELVIEDSCGNLSDMVFREYGKGYLVIPPTDSCHFGDKYFHTGWWIEKRRGWFFKQSEYRWIIDNGAIELLSDDEESVESIKKTDEDLSSMCFEKYGKGFMLYVPKTDPRFRQGYLLEGFWNKKTEGWFFQNKFFSILESRGAKYIKSEDDNVSLCSACTEESGDAITQTSTTRRVTRSHTKTNQKVGNMHLVYSYDDNL
jgi:hypothetical protein